MEQLVDDGQKHFHGARFGQEMINAMFAKFGDIGMLMHTADGDDAGFGINIEQSLDGRQSTHDGHCQIGDDDGDVV